MGPYCSYCQNRCFVPFPKGTPDEAIKSYRSTVTIIATCQEGQQFEMERTGWCYNKIMEAIMMNTRLHSLKFALEQTDLARWTVGDQIIEVTDNRNGSYTLDLAGRQKLTGGSTDEIEDELLAWMPEYTKGARVWDDIGE